MANRKRDKKVNAELKGKNYIVLRFWDDQIEKKIDRCMEKVQNTLKIMNKMHFLMA